MQVSGRFSCVIIGGGSLPTRCGDMLLSRGHTVVGVVYADDTLREWAEGRGIASIGSSEDLTAFLGSRSFDYLFSVVNYRLLDESILATPRRLAINYHDGPLPRYAGSYVTSWAIMNHETTHGVTWHVMTSKVDAGAVLAQRMVDVAPTETALSLNAKCFEAASVAFGELIDDLAFDRVIPREQDPEQRTFIPRLQRPSAQGVISWSLAARDIHALVRGLDFGNYPNPIALPKVLVGDSVFAVREATLGPADAGAAPATITAISAGSIDVATSDGVVSLRRLTDMSGREYGPMAVVREHGLSVGSRLPQLDPEMVGRIDDITRTAARNESYWASRLARLQPIALPSLSGDSGVGAIAPAGSRAFVLSEDANVTLPAGPERTAFLMAAFSAFVARLTGTTIFDIGFRPQRLGDDISELPPIFAPFVPFTVAVDPMEPFERHLSAVREQLNDVRQRGTYALDLLLRDPALRAGNTSVSLPLAFVEADDVASIPAMAPGAVALAVAATGEASWLLGDGALSDADIKSLSERFVRFVQGVASAPEVPIRNHSLLSAAERHHVLVELNATADPFPDHECLHTLVEAQAARTPDATAIWHESGSLTYRELDQSANRIAGHLRRLGVHAETLVGISMQRTPDMVVAMLGILKAGGAYVPLDPKYPRDRVEFMLADSNTRVVISDEASCSNLPAEGREIVVIDRDRHTFAAESVPGTTSFSSANLAYVIYTSGSTGRPKGVAIEHRNAVALLHWARSVFTDADLNGVLASTSICFDLSVFEIFVTLSRGGRVVLVDNALALPKLPASAGVTLVNTVPSAMAELLRTGRGLPESVEVVNLAGEPLSTTLVDRIYECRHVRRVYDLYGPSEDTTYSTWALRRPGQPPTIGRPIANTQAYLLDSFGEPVPFGLPGELYLGGAGVARGYLNRPELTAERFIPNPFTGRADDRLYRTGDLAHYLPNGDLRFLGRIDNQVKIRGFRIELGEIETALQRHPGVQEAVVNATQGPGERQLVAYVVPTSGHRLDTATLRSFLSRSLPDYMVPSVFVALKRIPMTPNGKVDRRALPSPDTGRLETGAEHVAPRNELETTVAGVWEKALGRKPISTRDNFFDLGADSLTILYVSELLERSLERPVSLVQIYANPTVESLVRSLGHASAPDDTVEDGAGRGEARRQALRHRARRKGGTRTLNDKAEAE